MKRLTKSDYNSIASIEIDNLKFKNKNLSELFTYFGK